MAKKKKKKKIQSQAAYRLGEEDSSWNACLGLAIWDNSALKVSFLAMTHWKEKLSIEKNSHYRFDQSRTFLNVSIHKITFGKDSLCLLNSWETEKKKKKKLPVAQKKNITNVFIVLSGLKKWHHQFSPCFAWNGRRREAAFAGPLCVRSIGLLGASPLLFTDPLQSRSPILDLKGHSPPTVRAFLPIIAYHHRACRKQ